MSLVYSMVPIGRTPAEKDMTFMFREKAPFKINCGSGAFRIFLTEIKIAPDRDGFMYKGTVSDCTVEGFYNPSEKRGTIIFGQPVKVKVS